MSRAFRQKLAEVVADIPNSKPAALFRKVKSEIGSRPLVLYGAGRLGSAVMAMCAESGMSVQAICDKNAGGELRGVEVVTPRTLRRDYGEAVVVVCSATYNDEICGDLAKIGFAEEQIVPCPVSHPTWEPVSEFRKHFNGYEWAYDFYTDERSKKLVIDRLRLHLLDEALEVNTRSKTYYEEGVVALGNREIFLDGGAYDGDSAEEFIKMVKNTNGGGYGVFAFEPDAANFEAASRRLSKYPGVEVIQKGLWSEETELVFFRNSADAAGSSFVIGKAAGEAYRVPVTSPDSFFKGKAADELPTFIKMDIEGAEREALLGSKEIIRKVKPKLAICAYHKPEDIYELPRTIREIRDDYRFCLRQHEAGYWDTVLYAV
ncbi:MAG: FkbM family methyltransferase [Oscillospiraceae bacterium]|jgi:FkbM family methyltransferase|nr:FkbM family methyltransferase [Oscillospiraceae bacterium]